MMEYTDVMDVFELLEIRGYVHDPVWGGYQSKHDSKFISDSALLIYPGDVRNYLQTGFIRNIKIFDLGFASPSAKDLGFRTHKKDGHPVQIKRVK